jgi:hypothetical protein
MQTLNSIADVTLAETETQDGKKQRKFSMLAYSGAPVQTFLGKMIVDLEGLEVDRPDKPILLNHDRSRIAGSSTKIENTGKNVMIDGNLSNVTAAGQEVAALSDESFPWQASIGFGIDRLEYLEDDESEKVNGRAFDGPGYIVTKSELLESSFVPVGADKNTSGVVMSDDLVTCFERDGHIGVIDYFNSGEDIMSKDADPQMTVAEFSTKNPEAVEQWKKEGHDAGVGEGRTTLLAEFNALHAEFAERPGFVCSQFAKGNDVDAAKAEFATVLQAELEESRAQNAELQKKLDEVEEGDDGVQFADGNAGKAAAELTAAQEWEQNKEGCQQEFGSFDAFARFKAHIDRQDKIDAERASRKEQ